MVSVVLPVYNREKLVERAIDSILNQTFSDFELILIDDGSTDNTLSVLEKYAKQDRRVRLFKNSKNKGCAYSRQMGLLISKGKYIAIMDSDDFALPERLEKSVKFMEKHSDIDILSGVLEPIDNRTEEKLNFIQKDYEYSYEPGQIEIDLMFYNVIPNVTSFIRKSFIDEHYISYNMAMQSAEDYDFWKSCVLAGGKFARLNDILTYAGSEDKKRANNYYEFMVENSIEIHRQFFSLFFKPTKEELKFSYSLQEKCSILKKMVQNPSKIIEQSILVNAYQNMCPADLSSAMYFIHDFWSDYLIPQKEFGRYKRLSVNDYATVEQTSDEWLVKWDKYKPERFVCKDNQCIFKK